jgi:hypothetical protein
METPSLDHSCAREHPQHQEAQTSNLVADSCAVALHCPNADLWVDTGGRFYTSAWRGASESELDRIGSRFRLVMEKDRMHWSAGLERGPDGAFYISARQVCRPSAAQGDVSPSAVFRISSEMLNFVASAR